MRIRRGIINSLITLFLLCTGATSADTLHVTNDTNINLATPNQINGTSADILVRNVGSTDTRRGFRKVRPFHPPPGGADQQGDAAALGGRRSVTRARSRSTRSRGGRGTS